MRVCELLRIYMLIVMLEYKIFNLLHVQWLVLELVRWLNIRAVLQSGFQVNLSLN